MKTLALSAVLALTIAGPSLAETTPAATRSDSRVRTVFYRPNEPVRAIGAVGALLQIQLEQGEEIVKVAVSDQALIDGGAVPSDRVMPNANTSQDGNVMVSIAMNDILVKPLRPLAPQPLFVVGKKGNEIRNYTFELQTRDGALTQEAAVSYWVIHMIYPETANQATAAAAAAREQEKLSKELKAPLIRNTAYTVRGAMP